MSVKAMHDVAIIFDDLTEFYAVRHYIDALIKEKIVIDIYIAPNYSSELMFDTQKKISRLGYQVKELPTEHKKYKILLEPYPLVDKTSLDFDFRIKYSYSASSAKPDPVFTPEWNLPYDASIAYSKRDAEIRSVYGKAYVVPYEKYRDFKKKKNKERPNLLFLPTFGEVSSIGSLNDGAIRKIKEKYNLIIKAHHAVQFNPTERGHYNSIKKMADEFYDSDTPLENLLARADVVLSDNSGAIFEAIYAGTPVAVFSDKLNERKLRGINTFQYELVKDGIVPCATKSMDILKVLDEAVKLSAKQEKVKQQYFSVKNKDAPNDFVSIIKEYLLKNRENEVYFMSRDILVNDYKVKKQKIEELESKLQQLQAQTIKYENSRSWKITRPLRKLNKFTGRKKI